MLSAIETLVNIPEEGRSQKDFEKLVSILGPELKKALWGAKGSTILTKSSFVKPCSMKESFICKGIRQGAGVRRRRSLRRKKGLHWISLGALLRPRPTLTTCQATKRLPLMNITQGIKVLERNWATNTHHADSLSSYWMVLCRTAIEDRFLSASIRAHHGRY